MNSNKVVAKLGNMKKAVEWTVYPKATDGSDEDRVIIQSHARIAAIKTSTGKALLSKACPNGAYFCHLHPAAGATVVDVDPVLLALVVTQIPQPGQEIGPGLVVG